MVPIHRHLGQFQALADSSGGQVRLLIDGVSQGVFDLSSATPQPRSFSFGNLTSGAHVLQVASYRGRATLDTFSAPGSVPFFTPPTRSGIVRYEEDDPALRYNGVPFASSVTSWAMGSMSRLSRGYGAWSKLANNSASLSFTGSWVSLGFASQTNAGKAELFIDGSSRGVIDTYSSTNDVVSATYSNLTAGSHTLSLTVLGQRNTNASDNYVHLDYIDVWDGTAMSQGTVEQDDARVWPSSGWQSSSEATASGSTYISGGTNLWLPFTGDSVTYQARTCNGCGSVEVLLDGQSHGAFSLNSSTTATRAWTFAGLGAGPHLLRVKAAQGAATVDAFEAPGRTPGSAPANLRAAGTTQTSITLVWDAATAQSDVTGYDVYTGATLAASVTGTSATLTNLTAGTAYSLSVKAKDAANNVSPASTPLTVTTNSVPTSITLVAQITPSAAYTQDRVLSLLVEARDQNGNLVPDYRGAVDFTPTAPTIGLPQVSGADYTFTAADAGRHVFSSIAFTQAGSQSIAVVDRANAAIAGTSNSITVQALTLSVTVSPNTAVVGVPAVRVHVEARDGAGMLVPGYRGTVTFSSTSAQIGLPTGGLLGGNYTFTEDDAGQHDWAITLNTAGQQTIAVSDGVRQATSDAVTVQPVTLSILVNPATVFAGEPATRVRVEARDGAGNLVPGYRGTVTFSSTSAQIGLPTGGLLGGNFTFTEDDGGHHEWNGVTLNTTGQQTISVSDGILQATSNPITVLAVSLQISATPTTVFVGEPALTVHVEARDQNNNLVPGYRGTIGFSSTSAQIGLPTIGLGQLGYTFTAADGGAHEWSGVTLNTAGQQTISVSDGTRSATSSAITVLAVSLQISVSPTTVFAGEAGLTVRVEARDQNNNLVPGYRGTIGFSSTSAQIGLPTIGLGQLGYTFTAADGGAHEWTGVTLNTAGAQTITVSDGTRQATSSAITVQAINLQITASPTPIFAGTCALQVRVEARDDAGNLVPSYRGTIGFTSSSAQAGLPEVGLGQLGYTFTPTDAGAHEWTGIVLHNAGAQTITVSDGTRQATSSAITVNEVFFRIGLSPDQVYAYDRDLTLSVDVVDAAGQVVTGYCGSIDFSSTAGVIGLPQGTLSLPDYTFTSSDAGQITIPNLAFTAAGDQAITVSDHANAGRQTTSPSIHTTAPPDPTPAPAGSAPAAYSVPGSILLPAPLPYSWGQPFRAVIPVDGLNHWKGYPSYPVPVRQGAFYIISGMTQRMPFAWWPTNFYGCAYFGWENPLTSTRMEGGFFPPPYMDPTFSAGSHAGGCGEWSGAFNAGAVTFLGPFFTTAPATADDKGGHAVFQAAGNVPGSAQIAAGGPGDNLECDGQKASILAGDPIDTRDGTFFLNEHDLGVATGCQEVALHFERAYSTLNSAATALSPGWVHNYEQRVTIMGDYALVQRPRGSRLLFKDVGGDVYATRAGDAHTLVKRPGGGWALIYRDRRADLFDADGKLIAQQDPNGNMLWMTYESYTHNGVAGTRLARVDAPGGRYLWLGYDHYAANRLIMVGDNSGRQVRFGYDDQGRLTSAADPLGAVATYAYSSTVWLMTSKTDALGHTTFTNTYDQDGRVVQHTMNLGHELNLSYAVITDTATIQSRVGTAEAAGLAALNTTTIIDQTGARAEYVYGDDGLLRVLTDPLGATTRYRGYTSTRKPTEVEDALGHVTQSSYNDLGLPTVITDTLGQVTQLTYDGWGNLLTIRDPLDRHTTLTYDGPNLVGVADPLQHTMRFQYGAQAGWQGMLNAIVQNDSITTTLTYNSAGDITAVTDPLGNLTRMGYDALGRPITLTDARGSTTILQYDAGDHVTQITDALSGTTHLAYDMVGNVIGVQDPIGATTLITYTANYQPSAVQDADGGVVRIGYTTLGQPITATNQLGQQSAIAYDRGGRMVAMTDPLGHTTRYGYDLLGNTTVITDANGHATHITYDALARPTEVRNAAGQFLRYGYDAVGNTIAMTDTLGAAVHLTYDALGRTQTVVNPLGHTTTYTYTALGWLDAVRDANGTVTQYSHDALGRLLETIANARPGLPSTADTNVRTQYAYDPVGNLRRLTDPRGTVTQFSYTALGQLESTTDPLNRTMHYQYDPRGLLTQWQKADGTPINYTYNQRGLLTSLLAPDQTVQYDYDSAGQRSAMHDATGVTAYTYNAASQPVTVTLSTGEALGYRYDAAGNRTQTIYPDGKTVTTAYTAANQPDHVTAWDGGSTQYAYDGNGRPATVTLPNGVVTTAGYDAAGNLTALTHTKGGSTIGTYAYAYDPTGRRTQAIEAGRTITYTYDGLYRLTDASESTGDQYQYTYDAAGNRLSKIEPSGTLTATYDAANQFLTLNGLPVQYDGNGNLLDDGMQTYQYDHLDRLISTTRTGATTQFGYTGDGDRLWEATAGVTTTFTLDLNTALTQVLAQHTATQTTRFLPGIGQQLGSAWQYVHADALGNVRQVTDANGTVLGSRRYSPFGEVVAGTGSLSPLGFTGEHQDAASGLTYLRARYYSAGLGRFLTPDSIVPDVANGQAWNAYAYAENDVVNRVDPSGFASGPPNPINICTYTPICSSWSTDVLDLVGDAFNSATSAVSRWWNKPNCACSDNKSRDTFVAGVMGALFAGIGTTPVEPTATLNIRTCVRPLGDRLGLFASEWKDVYQESGTYAEMASLRPRGFIGRVAGVERFSRRAGLLTVAETEKQFSNNGLRGLQRVKGGSGLIGGLALSGLIDAILKLQADSSRCLAGKDRLYNAAIAGLFGVAAAGVGALAFAIVAAGAPEIPLVALGVGIAAGYFADNVSHIGPIENPIVTIRDGLYR